MTDIHGTILLRRHADKQGDHDIHRLQMFHTNYYR